MLLIIYFIFEFSVLSLTSPIIRVVVLLLIVIFTYIGSRFINYKKLYKLNFLIWFVLYIIMLLNLTLFDKYFGREGVSIYLINLNYFEEYFKSSFNIIPFSTINNYLLALRNGNLAVGDFIYNHYLKYLLYDLMNSSMHLLLQLVFFVLLLYFYLGFLNLLMKNGTIILSVLV